jgi:hypothetical protein
MTTEQSPVDVPPGDISLATCNDPVYLLGRLLRVAAEAGWVCDGETGRSAADKLFEYRRPITPLSVAEMRQGLRRHRDRLRGLELGAQTEEAINDIETREHGYPQSPLTIRQKELLIFGWHHQGGALRSTGRVKPNERH